MTGSGHLYVYQMSIHVLPQILLILASIVAITVYRLAAFFAFSARLRAQDLKELEPLKEYVTPQMATSVTASLISFIVIMILNILYERVAIWITNFGETDSRVLWSSAALSF